LRIRVHTADATKQFRPVGIGGVYWALFFFHNGKPVRKITATINSGLEKQQNEMEY